MPLLLHHHLHPNTEAILSRAATLALAAMAVATSQDLATAALATVAMAAGD